MSCLLSLGWFCADKRFRSAGGIVAAPCTARGVDVLVSLPYISPTATGGGGGLPEARYGDRDGMRATNDTESGTHRLTLDSRLWSSRCVVFCGFFFCSVVAGG